MGGGSDMKKLLILCSLLMLAAVPCAAQDEPEPPWGAPCWIQESQCTMVLLPVHPFIGLGVIIPVDVKMVVELTGKKEVAQHRVEILHGESMLFEPHWGGAKVKRVQYYTKDSTANYPKVPTYECWCNPGTLQIEIRVGGVLQGGEE